MKRWAAPGLVVLALAAGCSEAQQEQAIDTAVTTLMAELGAQELASAGVQLSGGLDCGSADDSDVTTVQVSCTGETDSGEPVEFLGTADAEIVTGEINGEFTATVAGEEVYSSNCLGCGGEGGEGGEGEGG
ncbi:hypothetical protein [Allonocardiopsis opalescens]|uniref:Lipoprotein n=1 Tax=Allonocardiopsis opalescens TaxID=1144618 RepID=A0A2T0QDI7_9ACTN|nr:hypothetical protein [Allonocardiopsis opalescens]PRY01997.1 hypothetical protein CLV72_101595 [Allonocardiopsis opalescens]